MGVVPCRGDELLGEQRLGVDPSGRGDLPGAEAQQQRDHGLNPATAIHAARSSRAYWPVRATAPAAKSASNPSSSCSVAAVSVCGSWASYPWGRLVFTMALFNPFVGPVGVASTATRLVYALTRWCSSATLTTLGFTSSTGAPRASSSMCAAIFALAQRAPTPAEVRSTSGVSATLQGLLPLVPVTITVPRGARAAAATRTGSPR